MDHDQRFKQLISELLPELIDLSAPKVATLLDFPSIEWMPQEVYLDPHQGNKRTLDLVARVRTRKPIRDPKAPGGIANEIVIDVEVESRDSLERLRPQIHDYFGYLRRKYQVPVFSVGLLLNVGLNGIGWDKYEDRHFGKALVRFQYAYLGLPALDGMSYLRGNNILGVALSALMRMPSDGRARIKAEAFRRIALSDKNDHQKHILAECFDAYFVLSDEENEEFERIQQEEDFREIRAMTSLWTRQGQLETDRRLLRLLIEKRFGVLSKVTQEKINALSVERLEELIVSFSEVRSLEEVGLK